MVLTEICFVVTKPAQISNVLVVHPGGLGDLVLLSGLIASLRQGHPGSLLTLVCRNEFADIVNVYPVRPDEVVGLSIQPYACTELRWELRGILQQVLLRFKCLHVTALIDAALQPNWLPE